MAKCKRDAERVKEEEKTRRKKEIADKVSYGMHVGINMERGRYTNFKCFAIALYQADSEREQWKKFKGRNGRRTKLIRDPLILDQSLFSSRPH